MEIKGEIAFTADIIERMYEELDMPKERIKNNVALMLECIHKKSLEEDVGAMFISHIGTMYFKQAAASKYMKAVLEHDPDTKSKPFKQLVKKINKLKPIFESRKNKSPQLKRQIITNFRLTKRRSIKEVEEFQNKIYNEWKSQKYN